MGYVFLAKKPEVNDFRSDYFPRSFRYKEEAQNLLDEVEHKQGTAVVLREPTITAKQEGGDDGFCYVVRVDGREYINGLTRGEVRHYKERALKCWLSENTRKLLAVSQNS